MVNKLNVTKIIFFCRSSNEKHFQISLSMKNINTYQKEVNICKEYLSIFAEYIRNILSIFAK